MQLESHKCVTTLRFMLPSESWAREWLLRGSRPQKGKRWDIERSLVNITRVEISAVGGGSFNSVMKPLFLRWLALFPALQHVVFDSPSFFNMSMDERPAFVQSVGEVCCGVETVQIGFIRHIVHRQASIERIGIVHDVS